MTDELDKVSHPKQVRIRMTDGLDKVSQLPGHVTDRILSCLPIKEAVRTSILSRKWRYKWCSVPQLVFDDQCTNAQSLDKKLGKIIDMVLLLHTGPLHKFELSLRAIHATNDIDPWILHLSRVCIKVIVLEFWEGNYYKIPTSLFNCHDLIHLELYGCLVKIPSTFEGFKNLETLNLQCIKLSPDDLEALISRSPLLKTLMLTDLDRIKKINIEVGNLECLDVEGAFQDVAFGVMNRLKSVMVCFSADIANERGPNDANSSSLLKFFRNLSKIQSLKLTNYSLKHLAVGNVPRTLPNELVHLKSLYTCIDFSSVEEILTVMCLIRSSPQLKQLDFEISIKDELATTTRTMADFWKDYHTCCLEQVQVIWMDGLSDSESELEFVKFLLTNSPNLQEMTIQPNSTSGEGKLLRELLRFRRASALAEVIFLDPDDEEAHPC